MEPYLLVAAPRRHPDGRHRTACFFMTVFSAVRGRPTKRWRVRVRVDNAYRNVLNSTHTARDS